MRTKNQIGMSKENKILDNLQNINNFITNVPFFVRDIDSIRHLFPWQPQHPQWLKEYLLLIKTRRGNKYYVVKGLSFGAKFSVKGFSKFKVVGWRNLP